mmetsp:Transcript_24056/g.48575  ORF Transcript_24056/g.48575 Transcript_24056/m.48575 type:complete len:269 (-) Transcript_24056:2246-3052(-)
MQEHFFFKNSKTITSGAAGAVTVPQPREWEIEATPCPRTGWDTLADLWRRVQDGVVTQIIWFLDIIVGVIRASRLNPAWVWKILPNPQSDFSLGFWVQGGIIWCLIHHSSRLVRVLEEDIFFFVDGYTVEGDEDFLLRLCPAFGNGHRCADAIAAADEGRITMYLVAVVHYFTAVIGHRMSYRTKTFVSFCQVLFVGDQCAHYWELTQNWLRPWIEDTNCFSIYEDNGCTAVLWHSLGCLHLILLLFACYIVNMRRNRTRYETYEKEL